MSSTSKSSGIDADKTRRSAFLLLHYMVHDKRQSIRKIYIIICCCYCYASVPLEFGQAQVHRGWTFLISSLDWWSTETKSVRTNEELSCFLKCAVAFSGKVHIFWRRLLNSTHTHTPPFLFSHILSMIEKIWQEISYTALNFLMSKQKFWRDESHFFSPTSLLCSG